MESFFYTITGLPIHALIVHFAVVLLPLAAFAIAVAVYVPKFREKLALTSLVITFLGFIASFIAKQSGEALASHIGLPKEHADYGNILPIVAFAFFLIASLWYRSVNGKNNSKPTLLGHGTALAAVLVMGLTFVTGHTGAEAVWKNRLAAIDSKGTSTSKHSSQKSSTDPSYSLSEIAQHADATSCWSAIDGQVYDLTKWINRHPGGPSVIKAICGKDGSGAFNGQHQGQTRPASELVNYKIGALKQ